MSLAIKAARSAAWMFATGLGWNAVGLVGTLVLVHYVTPREYGEACAAAVVVGTAHQLSSLGIGQAVVVKGAGRPDFAFHAAVYAMAIGALALAGAVVLRGPLGALVDAPTMGSYVPGLALASLCERVSLVPERVLMREMRFRVVAVSRSAGEMSYSVVSVALAIAGLGGMAIVVGNVVRAIVRSTLVVRAVAPGQWLARTPIRRATTAELFGFGVPLSVGTLAGYASRKWDNLLVSRFFGPMVMAAYNLAYSLAETPAALVGDQMADVLLPSFANLPDDRRNAALVRSLGLLALVTCPLVVGLGAVAPTVVATFLDPRWASVGPMLAILSVMSVARPLGWTTSAYLQARSRARLVMLLEAFGALSILVLVAAVGRKGPLFTCAAVGLAYAGRAVAGVLVMRAIDGVPLAAVLRGQLGPLAACVPMIAGVLAVRHGIGLSGPLALVAETGVGAAAYVAAALLLAREHAVDLLDLARRALRRAGPRETPEAELSASRSSGP